MNINPSDTDVRQGYPLAESAAGTKPVGTILSASEATVSFNPAPSQQKEAEETRSLAAAASADRMTAKETAKKLQEKLANTDTGLKIRVLDDSKSSVQVEVVDEKSNKVLRKIPQDELLKLSASIKEMSGVLVDKPT